MAWHRRLGWKFSVMVGLHVALAYMGVSGFVSFVLPQLGWGLYCWQVKAFYGVACGHPHILSWLMLIGTLAMTGLIVRMCLRFAGRWRLYLEPSGE